MREFVQRSKRFHLGYHFINSITFSMDYALTLLGEIDVGHSE